MEFKVSFYEGGAVPAGSKRSEATELKPVSKVQELEAEGIKIKKWGLFPTCFACGLEDRGKKAPERPDYKHQINCKERKLSALPFDELNGVRSLRTGQFEGEGVPITLNVPCRIIRMIPQPVFDEAGNHATGPDGNLLVEKAFSCSYKKKQVSVNDWIWKRGKWVPFYEYDRSSELKPPQEIPAESDSRKAWLACFMKK